MAKRVTIAAAAAAATTGGSWLPPTWHRRRDGGAAGLSARPTFNPLTVEFSTFVASAAVTGILWHREGIFSCVLVFFVVFSFTTRRCAASIDDPPHRRWD